MLRQAGAFRENQVVAERVMDSNPLEKERGITILAKNTSVALGRHEDQHRRHAGPRRLRRRGRAHPAHGRRRAAGRRRVRRPDAADALRAPQGARARPHADRRASTRSTAPAPTRMRVHDEVLDLFIELEANDEQLDAPVVYASGRDGTATMDLDVAAGGPDAALRDDRATRRRRRRATRPAPFQMLVSTIDYSHYLGRLAIGRIERGTVQASATRCTARSVDHHQEARRQARVTKLYGFEGLERIEVPSGLGRRDRRARGPRGRRDRLTPSPTPSTPERLEGIAVEEPTISVDFLVNNSPFAGKEGKFVTSRQLAERLDQGARAQRRAARSRRPTPPTPGASPGAASCISPS